MFIPAARQRVRVLDCPEELIVLAVDREDGLAYVVPVTGGQEPKAVPFTSLEPVRSHQPTPNRTVRDHEI